MKMLEKSTEIKPGRTPPSAAEVIPSPSALGWEG